MCGSFVMLFALLEHWLWKQTKRAEPLCLLETEGSAKPVKANKQQNIHARIRELMLLILLLLKILPIFSYE